MRFSLRTLLITTAVISLVCCVFFALPNWLTVVVFLLSAFLLPVAAVSAVVFTRGYWRAFGVGTLVVVGFWPLIFGYYILILVFSGGISEMLSQFGFSSNTDDITGMKIGFAVTYVLVAMAGLTSVAIRWLAVRSQTRARQMKRAEARSQETTSEERYEIISGRVSMQSEEDGPIPDKQLPDSQLPDSLSDRM